MKYNFSQEDINASLLVKRLINNEKEQTLMNVFSSGMICMHEDMKIDWQALREKFFDECVVGDSPRKIEMLPSEIFEWFKKELSK